MVVRDVQLIEVVVPGLDFRTKRRLEPEQGENVAEFFNHLRNWVGCAEWLSATRKGDIYPICRQPLIE